MPWLMKRAQRAGEPASKYAKIVTSVQIVRPKFDGGQWVAMVDRRAAMFHLRNLGFDVHEIRPPVEAVHVPMRDAPLPPKVTLPTAREQRSNPWALDCWRTWLDSQPPPDPFQQRRPVPWDVLRAPLEPLSLKRRPAATVGVVLTMTGYTKRERDAVAACGAEVKALGKASRLVIVQNGDVTEGDRAAMEADAKKAGGVVVTVENRGFAAACNAGLAATPKTCRWILFTQPDAEWSAATVKRATTLSETYGAEGKPAVVGPSGGYILDVETGTVTEYGRNIDDRGDPVSADFVAGYWLLAPRAAVAEVGGWTEAGYLYMEDPDLCCRLASIGHRSVVASDLDVNHRRGETIKGRLYAPQDIAEIQGYSRAVFGRTWR